MASGAGTPSSAASGERVTWRHPVMAGTTAAPNMVRWRFECDEVFKFFESEQAVIAEMEAQWYEVEEEKKQEDKQAK